MATGIITGLKSVQNALRRIGVQFGLGHSVAVVYTANYAVHVHENEDIPHNNGQAKFLEQPAREMSGELGEIVATLVSRGTPVKQALFLAGLRLQAASQKLVPVLTGNLKGSADTRIER